MHRARQGDHSCNRVILRQGRIDDIAATAPDYRVTSTGGQNVPEEKKLSKLQRKETHMQKDNTRRRYIVMKRD
jgi:hypothetical protein